MILISLPVLIWSIYTVLHNFVLYIYFSTYHVAMFKENFLGHGHDWVMLLIYSATFCLLISAFRSFAYNVIISMSMLNSTILFYFLFTLGGGSLYVFLSFSSLLKSLPILQT